MVSPRACQGGSRTRQSVRMVFSRPILDSLQGCGESGMISDASWAGSSSRLCLRGRLGVCLLVCDESGRISDASRAGSSSRRGRLWHAAVTNCTLSGVSPRGRVREDLGRARRCEWYSQGRFSMVSRVAASQGVSDASHAASSCRRSHKRAWPPTRWHVRKHV